MADKLLREFKQQISGLELQPSTGGCFEISVDGRRVYSKLETGQFPNEADVPEMIRQATVAS